MRLYKLQEFLNYPNFAYKLAMVVPYNCNENGFSKVSAIERWPLWRRLWFGFGAICLIYQNFGLLIALLVSSQRKQQEPLDTAMLIGQISEAGSIMGLTIVGSCKMWSLLGHGERIAKLLQDFHRIFPNEHKQIMSAYRLSYFAQNSQLLMSRTTIFFIFAFCYYNSLPLVISLYELLMTGQLSEYHYQSNTWYPWHKMVTTTQSSWLCFVATYGCQLQSSLTGVAFIMAGEFMVCFFVTQMRLHFDFLARALRRLNADAPNANEQLKRLIEYHSRLLRFTKEINRIFNMSFMVNFATAAIAICLMGFSMVMISLAHAIKYSVGLMAFLVFTVFLCYNGTQFTDASQEIFPAAFHNNWYEGDMAYRKMLLFFMMRAKDANRLMAYKFYAVSMETFMAILKLSYQLFTFFRAMS